MPASELINELDDIGWRLENIFRADPTLMRKWKPKAKHLETVATNTARVRQLCEMWTNVPQSLLLDFATEESKPFVVVAVGLAKHKYTCVPLSLCMWWRRMLATGQQNVLTYFSWDALDRLCLASVTGSDLLRACTDNISLLENIKSALVDDQSIDFRVRDLLGGLSKQSDVKAAWKKWAMTHHPDKGGDPEEFLKVKVVYEEWLMLNKESA